GVTIGTYQGVYLSLEQVQERYPGNWETEPEYLFHLGDDDYLDAADPEEGNFTRYINHSSENANLDFEVDQANRLVTFETIRRVKKGEELVFDYGEDYWSTYEGDIED
ncbi:unnamed protein product, partial [Chrysoparadoxa australica]